MKKRKISCLAWLCLISILYQGNGFAQVSEGTLKNCPIKNFVKTVGGDLLHVASSPLRMSKNDGLRLLIVTTITAGFVARVDSPIDEEFGIEVDDAYWLPAQGLARIGEVYDQISPEGFSTALSIAMLTGGVAFRDKKLLETTRLMIESSLITHFITTWSKDLFGRSRPYTGKGPHHFELFASKGAQEFRSMPSGHVSSAFSVMTVIAKRYDKWWVKIPAYTFAISVAFQRMNSRTHWASDVIIGAGIGYWVGSTLVNRQPDKSKSSSFSPYLLGNRIGLLVNF